MAQIKDIPTQISPDGQRAVEMHDDGPEDGEGKPTVRSVARPSTLEEQVAFYADEIRRVVVGSVPAATTGEIEVNGSTVTVVLQ